MMGKELPFKVGDIVPYTNTASKTVWAKITIFKEIGDNRKKTWFDGTDTKTGAHVFYPVHISKNILDSLNEYANKIIAENKYEERIADLIDKVNELNGVNTK
jgi:hypothetical protein